MTVEVFFQSKETTTAKKMSNVSAPARHAWQEVWPAAHWNRPVLSASQAAQLVVWLALEYVLSGHDTHSGPRLRVPGAHGAYWQLYGTAASNAAAPEPARGGHSKQLKSIHSIA
jgi:hypothetical protein